MRSSSFTTVYSSETWQAADELIGRLRQAGLHPMDLSLSAPLAIPGTTQTYPVEVPGEEADIAREVIKSLETTRTE